MRRWTVWMHSLGCKCSHLDRLTMCIYIHLLWHFDTQPFIRKVSWYTIIIPTTYFDWLCSPQMPIWRVGWHTSNLNISSYTYIHDIADIDYIPSSTLHSFVDRMKQLAKQKAEALEEWDWSTSCHVMITFGSLTCKAMDATKLFLQEDAPFLLPCTVQ